MRRFSVPVLSPAKRVIYVFVALSGAGWVFVEVAPEVARNILAERWTPEYWVLAPFFHGALWHFLLNAMALNFLGEPMLRALGERRFVTLFAVGILAGNLANNLFAESPAVGISAGVLGILAAMTYPFGRAPMKFLVLHDLLRLPPFQLWKIAAGLVGLDVAGIVFQWGVFAHWGHLGGFLAGLVAGWVFFRRPPDVPMFDGWRRRG